MIYNKEFLVLLNSKAVIVCMKKNDIIILEKKGFCAIATIEDIAKVNILEDGEIGFGSTEYIVFELRNTFSIEVIYIIWCVVNPCGSSACQGTRRCTLKMKCVGQ